MTAATLRRRIGFGLLATALVLSTVILMADQAGAGGGQPSCGANPTIVDDTATLTTGPGCDLVVYAYAPTATEQLQPGTDLTASYPQTKHGEATTTADALTVSVELPCGFSQIDVLAHGDNPAVIDQAFIDGPLMADFIARFRGGLHATRVCTPVVPPVVEEPPAAAPAEIIDTAAVIEAPPAVPVRVAELPYTGAGTERAAALGLGLLAAGFALVATTRRRLA